MAAANLSCRPSLLPPRTVSGINLRQKKIDIKRENGDNGDNGEIRIGLIGAGYMGKTRSWISLR
ncbi:hypothetical protein [Collimonas silvisoli]|uniref:hypothetical protein n=1 Tax=Collimonas silvisoli TaxID=2825884 RepID=UPI001B8BDAD3|nr:hypothetical protein [Collimonas silvisoli]